MTQPRCTDDCCRPTAEVEFEPIARFRITARKQYDCMQCSFKIEPGQNYDRVVRKVDGRILSWREHDENCWNADSYF